jgi:hypothetical protein
VLTFKEGLLSRVAHDLKLRVERLGLEVADDAVTAWFDATSLRVVTAMKDGRESPGALSDADKRTIERNIREDVLDATRHPQIRFQSKVVERRGDEATIRGTLQLHGQEREGGAVVAEARLHQPDFGIKPYSAMMGTLRVKPDIEVRLRAQVPA